MYRTLFLTSALMVAGPTALTAAPLQPQRAPDLPEGAVAVTKVDGIPVGIALPRNRAEDVRSAGHFVPVDSAGATFNNLSKDRNARFLSWYGFQSYDFAQSTCSGSNCTYSSGYERLAIPITGRGNEVTSIRVPAVQVTGKGPRFSVAIYTNTESNTPGDLLPGASGTASAANSGYCCTELVTVSIPATKLRAGTTYWIVENGANQTNVYNANLWLGETTDFTQAGKMLVQTHTFLSYDGFVENNYTSSWSASTADRWTEPAAEIK
ncbi:MAG TPA: hypothetical protein VGF97_09965 [Rhizomicrobium sp.]